MGSMEKWNGVFSPNLTKSIGTVTLVPIDRMTDEDWDWLDWDNLRNTAKNRLAKKIVAGMVATLHVRLTEPEEEPEEEESEEEDETTAFLVFGGRRNKRWYIYGVVEEEADDFEEDNHDFFIHEAEVDEVDSAVDQIDSLRFDVEILPREAVVQQLASMLKGNQEMERRALAASPALSLGNFTLLVAIIVGLIAYRSGEDFGTIARRLLESLEDSVVFAAGRGLTPPKDSDRLGS